MSCLITSNRKKSFTKRVYKMNCQFMYKTDKYIIIQVSKCQIWFDFFLFVLFHFSLMIFFLLSLVCRLRFFKCNSSCPCFIWLFSCVFDDHFLESCLKSVSRWFLAMLYSRPKIDKLNWIQVANLKSVYVSLIQWMRWILKFVGNFLLKLVF